MVEARVGRGVLEGPGFGMGLPEAREGCGGEEREQPGQAGLSTECLCHPLRVKNQEPWRTGEGRELCDLKNC